MWAGSVVGVRVWTREGSIAGVAECTFFITCDGKEDGSEGRGVGCVSFLAWGGGEEEEEK